MYCLLQKNLMKQKYYFPQGEWAPKSALMAAYSYYTQDYYGDAISELERFITVYPSHENFSMHIIYWQFVFMNKLSMKKKICKSIIKSKKIFKLF